MSNCWLPNKVPDGGSPHYQSSPRTLTRQSYNSETQQPGFSTPHGANRPGDDGPRLLRGYYKMIDQDNPCCQRSCFGFVLNSPQNYRRCSAAVASNAIAGWIARPHVGSCCPQTSVFEPLPSPGFDPLRIKWLGKGQWQRLLGKSHSTLQLFNQVVSEIVILYANWRWVPGFRVVLSPQKFTYVLLTPRA
jgi:hypothetical protein